VKENQGKNMDAARLEQQYNKELEDMTDEIQAGVKEGRYSLNELQRAFTEKGKQAADVTDEFVRESPWTALGVAALVGCLIGFFINRR
jgi:ElaB/YqjD/DUF883 family membrane-anchored ribosome-binding protein